MNILDNEKFCEELGLKNGQKKPKSELHIPDLLWSMDNGRTYFGEGDLSDKDLKRIYKWLTENYDENTRIQVFTGWERTGGFASVRISMAAGITNPKSERRLFHYSILEG